MRISDLYSWKQTQKITRLKASYFMVVILMLAELQNAGDPPADYLRRTCQDKEAAPDLALLFMDLLERQDMVICNGLARFPTSGNYSYWSCPHKKKVLRELNARRVAASIGSAPNGSAPLGPQMHEIDHDKGLQSYSGVAAADKSTTTG